MFLIFAIIIVIDWYVGQNKTANSYEYLQKMIIVKIELRKEFDDVNSYASRSSNSSQLGALISECLSKLETIHDFRFGEELTWAKIAFIGINQEHHIGYSVLNNNTVLLGGFYVVKHANGETENVGLGSGMKSDCLFELISNV